MTNYLPVITNNHSCMANSRKNVKNMRVCDWLGHYLFEGLCIYFHSCIVPTLPDPLAHAGAPAFQIITTQ